MVGVSVTTNHRFIQTDDGRVWTQDSSAYEFWTRYLDVFDDVNVVARVSHADLPDPEWKPVEGQGVQVTPVPHYQGPAQYALRRRRVTETIGRAIRPNDAVILRSPSQVATVAAHHMIRDSRPYAVEVVADPWDVFSPAASIHPLRMVFRRVLSRSMRAEVKSAAAVAYVTEYALQRRYPPSSAAFVTSFSDVQLPDSAFRQDARSSLEEQPEEFRIVTISTLSMMYKGVDVLIQAVAKCIFDAVPVRLSVIGDGRYRLFLEHLARDLGISSQVEFLRSVPSGESVREALDNSHLFVLASRAEGLPRAVIEAMARGLPCIATNVGGVPELLEHEDMVEAGDQHALASLITHVLLDPSKRVSMSQRNLRRARSFSEERLTKRRTEFFEVVRELTVSDSLRGR